MQRIKSILKRIFLKMRRGYALLRVRMLEATLEGQRRVLDECNEDFIKTDILRHICITKTQLVRARNDYAELFPPGTTFIWKDA